MKLSFSRREYLGAMAGSAVLSVVPAQLQASAGASAVPAQLRTTGGTTDFYVVTSDAASGRHFLSALVSEPQHSHIELSPDRYDQFALFAGSVFDCVLVGLVDEAGSSRIESTLNDIGRSLQIVEYINKSEASAAAIKSAALNTMQTALAAANDTPEPASGQSDDDTLASFYVWL